MENDSRGAGNGSLSLLNTRAVYLPVLTISAPDTAKLPKAIQTTSKLTTVMVGSE